MVRLPSLVVLALVALQASTAGAGNQTVLGKSYTVKDPQPGVDPSLRGIVVLGKEVLADDTVVGNPIASGATVHVIANGNVSTTQTFTLPPGASVEGSAGWKALGSPPLGYSYKDSLGTVGPVKAAVIKKASSGLFTVKVTIKAANGPGPQPHVTVVPPAPGTDGAMQFTIGGGDTYCVVFGGTAGGQVTNAPTKGTPNKVFKVVSKPLTPTSEVGCPGSIPSTTSTSTSTSSSTSTSTSSSTSSSSSSSTSTSSSISTTSSSSTSTTVPPGFCCDLSGATSFPACFQTGTPALTAECLAQGGVVVPGMYCDGTTGGCGPYRAPATYCCQFTGGTPFCAESPTWFNSSCAPGGTAVAGATCGATSGACNGPPATCGTLVTKWGSAGSLNSQFTNPGGVATDASGNVYVADSGNDRIQKFTNAGAFILKWGTSGSGTSQFSNPTGVGVDASGNVYVADTNNNRIQKFTATGTFVTAWGSVGSANGQFDQPTGVTADGSGNVYVADFANDRVQKFTASGAFVTKWGTSGSADGEFLSPYGVATDASANVYVADAGNDRVQKFTATGTFVTKWGSSGSGNGQFVGPDGVATNAGGSVYVIDAGNAFLQKFTASGTFVAKGGGSGTGDGQMSFPSGIATGAGGTVFVADYGNNRIQKFLCP